MNTIVKFSEAASIAIHGTVLVAKSNEFMNVAKISEKLGASKHHVAKVMQNVKKGGFIKSLRGPLGGFKMVKNPEEISLLDLYQTVEGRVFNESVPDDPISKRLYENVTKKLTDEFIEYMSNNYLSDLM
jgi:Rrf2 family protein